MRPDLAFMDAIVPATADEALVMDEDAFRMFYERTARQVWAFLYRRTRDGALADDLLQETYYRLLRARRTFDSEAHRVHYLFRVAANLLADRSRRPPPTHVPLAERERPAGPATHDAAILERRADLDRALATLAPRDRDMLWLAYADGASHEEIAEYLGVGRPSIKAMLFRARQRLAARLRGTAAAFHGRDDPMTRSCARERDVLRAVARGWVGRGDDDTAAHAAACERCGAVRAAAELLRADHLRLAQAARVVPGAALWWRLERRRREEQARRAHKIAFALQAVMLAAAAGGTAAVVQLALPWMQASAGTATEAWRTIAAVLVEWSQSGIAAILPLALGVAAWLLLLPAAIYLGLVDE